MRRILFGLTLLFLGAFAAFALSQCSGNDKAANGGGDTTEIISGDTVNINADHRSAAAFTQIPASYITAAQHGFRIFYGHTSHGSQILSGMTILRDSSSTLDFNSGDTTVSFTEYGDDLGTTGDTTWVPITRQYLDAPGANYNIVMWSWCGGVSGNTAEGIDIYLNAMNQLEQDYPNVMFVYMTGHLDGTGTGGNLYARNSQIRTYCEANHKILFDFADIESYDPDGGYYPDAADDCAWCADWCATHACFSCSSCAHSHCFNCYLKGKAFWWMLARLAGWNGHSS